MRYAKMTRRLLFVLIFGLATVFPAGAAELLTVAAGWQHDVWQGDTAFTPTGDNTSMTVTADGTDNVDTWGMWYKDFPNAIGGIASVNVSHIIGNTGVGIRKYVGRSQAGNEIQAEVQVRSRSGVNTVWYRVRERDQDHNTLRILSAGYVGTYENTWNTGEIIVIGLARVGNNIVFYSSTNPAFVIVNPMVKMADYGDTYFGITAWADPDNGSTNAITAEVSNINIVYPDQLSVFAGAVSPCDVNGDGKIGMEEAITALQITSGLRPQEAQEISYWATYTTIDGLSGEDGPYYDVLTKTGAFIKLMTACDDDVEDDYPSGTLIDNAITLTWTESDGGAPVTFTGEGTMAADGMIMNGTWNNSDGISGAFRGDKLASAPDSKACAVDTAEAFCVYFPANGQYWVEARIEDPDEVVSTASISGDGITGTVSMVYNLDQHTWWTSPNIFISDGDEPTFPLNYTIHIEFNDDSTEDVTRMVTDWETAE